MAVLAVYPAAASAESFTATATSPRNPALDASLDLSQVSATFDTAGIWKVDVSLHAGPLGASPTGITSTLSAAAPAGGCGAPVAAFTSDPPPGAATVNLAGGAPHAARTLSSLSSSPGRFQAQVGDADLANVRPGCFSVTVANGAGVLDELASVPFTPGPVATPTPTVTPPSPTPSADTVVANRRTLKANRRGVVAFRLKRFDRAVKGTIRIRAGGSTSGRTIGLRAYRARAGRAAPVRVRLDRASRGRLKREGELYVLITATAHGGTRINHTDVFDTTIRRR